MKYSPYEYRHNAIINSVLAWKHGHIVAAVLSRAQLCKWHHIENLLPASDENDQFAKMQAKKNTFYNALLLLLWKAVLSVALFLHIFAQRKRSWPSDPNRSTVNFYNSVDR